MKRLSTILFLIGIIGCIPFRSEAQVVYEFANDQVTSTASCVSCSVKDSLFAVDGDLTTFSELEMQAGLPGSFVSQMLIFPTNACAGDTIYLVVENPLLALDSVLNGISISTSYKSNQNPDEQPVISSSILPGNLTLIKYTPAFAYDRLLVKMFGGIALGVSNLRIYYAYRFSELAQIQGNMLICQGQGTALSVSPVRASTVYSWYDEPNDGNLLHTGNNGFYTGILYTTTTFYVQRCANAPRQAFTVTVIDKPDIPVVLGQTTICKGEQVNLQATSVFPGANFKWYDAAGNEVITNNFYSAILNQSTRFIVYTVLNGCYSEPDTVDIEVVEHLATPQVQCGTPTINSILFEWNPVPGAIQYEVSLDLGNSYSTPTGTYSHLISSLNFGDIRTIFIRAIGDSPCWDTIVSTGVTCIATNCSAVTFNSPDKIEICREDTGFISLSNISSAAYEISWDNGPFVSETLYKKTIQQDDTVRVEVRDPAQPGCPTTVKYIPIDLLPAPEASFSSDKQLVTVPNGLVQFFDNTVGAQSWKWDFGDGQTSSDRNPVHLYQSPGKYTVTLEVTNVFGCKDTVIQDDFMEGKYAPQLFVPNTFTPNEDQLNDRFIAKGERIQQYYIQVFNASGKLLYEGRALNEGWDGTYMGEKQPSAPYFYKVDALADDNVEFHLKGIINLVR